MFSICPKSVFQNQNLHDIDLRVYLVLQSFANQEGYCFPCIQKMAEICNVSRRTVERSLARLENFKAIAREKRVKKDGGYTSNVYYLKLEQQAEKKVEDDTTNMSQPIRQNCRIPYDTDVATNNNQCNNNNFNLNNTRARAHEDLAKEVCASSFSLDDLNDVASCKAQVSQADNFNFFITKKGIIGCRPKSRMQDLSEFHLIYDFFFYKCAREIRLYKFDERGTNEILIAM